MKQTEEAFHLIGAGMGNQAVWFPPNKPLPKHMKMDAQISDAILISDAFFPFRDNVDLAHKSGYCDCTTRRIHSRPRGYGKYVTSLVLQWPVQEDVIFVIN